MAIRSYHKGIFGSLALCSHSAFALGEQVLQQDAATIDKLLIVIGTTFSFLLLALIYLKFSHSRARKAYVKNTAILDRKKQLLDNFHVGMVHVNTAGAIQYCNKLAAYYLGDRAENLLGKTLHKLLDGQDHEALTQSINAKVQCKLALSAPIKKRQLVLEFAPQKNHSEQVSSIISLYDISEQQAIVDKKTESLALNNQLLDDTAIGQLTLNLADKQFYANAVLCSQLGIAADAGQGELKYFEQFVHQSSQFAWNQAYGQLERGESAKFECRFDGQEQAFYGKLIGVVVKKDDNNKGLVAQLTISNHTPVIELKNQLAASKQQAKGLLSSSSAAMYTLDNQGLITNCNTPFEILFNTSIETIRHQNARQLACFSDELKEMQPDSGPNKGIASYSIQSGMAREIQITSPLGELKVLKVKIQPFRDNEGNNAGAVCSLEDISELKSLSAQLEQERQHFTDIINKAPLGIAMIDDDDRVVQANEALTKRLGLTAHELSKGSFYQLFNDAKSAGKAAKKLHKNGQLTGFHANLKGKSEQLHPSELNIELFDKAKQHFLCWISDISDEQYQQDKFESLLLHSSMPMAVLSGEGFNKLNPAACDFFRVEDEEELFGYFPYSKSLNSDDADLDQLKQKISQINQDSKALSLMWQHARGEVKLPCHATFVPMFKGQRLDSILCIWTDLRAIKQADAERIEAVNLQQAAERLIVEKQQLLESSQDLLASKVKSLSATESKLKAVKEDLSDKESEITSLQEAHESIAEHLNKLQADYQQSRESLASSEENNQQLAAQLEQSSRRVSGLERQRNQIANELQYSEKKYKTAQQELADSEATAERLEQERQSQQQAMQNFEGEIQQLKQSIQSKDQQISDVSGQINALHSKLSSSSQTSEKLRQQLINQRKASEQAELQRRDLEQSCFVAQSELSNKARHIDHLQHEMDKFEEMSKQQKGDMEKQQALLEQELANKQTQLHKTQSALDETKRQSEQDQAEKLIQQQRLEQLQQELNEVERHSEEQQQKVVEADKQWRKQQQELQQELQLKQQRLLETEQVLKKQELQVELEKDERAKQKQLLTRLQQELAEMEQRSDEQQRQKLEEANLNWQQQQHKFEAELEAKQQKLQQAEQNLNQAKQQTEAQKAEQRQVMERLQAELIEVGKRSEAHQKRIMEEADQRWKDKQEALNKELQAKQQRLIETEEALKQTAEQSEIDKQAKAQQQHLFERLQVELAEMEQRSAEQQQSMQESDQHWQQRQQELKQEVAAKQQQLQATRQQLDENQRQTDAEKRERLEQQQKLEQLKVELTDVESRAIKQKEMLQGSDEQWRQHHAEIEQQKQQLQRALQEAEQQNAQMKQSLNQSLAELQKAESQVSDTQSGEQKLQTELEQARNEAQQLQQRLKQQEQQELKLQQQLADQQQALQSSEQNIHSMQNEQQQLNQQLQAIQVEYDNTKANLNAQDSNQSELNSKLQQLEQELTNSKQQIASKETALQTAQKQLQSSQQKLQHKEKALVDAHKEELKQVQEQQPEISQQVIPDFAKLAMPKEPQIWFDLLPYLQKNPPKVSLALALSEMMSELEQSMQNMDKAVNDDDNKAILMQARKLAFIARKVNSAPLDDVATRLETDFQQGEVDSIAIFWPSVKESLMTTLRVIYAQLHA
ncbi:PAS domain S-box protein [Aliiglaciecola sp. LCG003]|uniref:PAS domain S-box protein n=1 Tax=Aliiglaciecola sp. LCG003 TaxID=3053655 RepID=UPI0025727D98|nr:PAS domain S-box protein [Aliiglaciecola sp. LCG003]WJG08594.1 PAS domain S-box protein [Aliiglaciecola sp. LCG003]